MKKIALTVAILFGCVMFKSADAQLRISLGFNIGSQPDWGPVGYDHASYYYMPDINAYYDVNSHVYVYYENNVWVHRTYLPTRYRNYDLYSGYKVVVNQRNPWERNAYMRTKYAGYKGRRGQQVIRESREPRYQNHWKGDDRRGPGNSDFGHDRGNQGNRNNDRGDRGNGNNDHGDRGNGNGHGNGHGKH
jgi:hypothetical protein